MAVGKRDFYPEVRNFVRMSAGMELRSGISQGVIMSEKAYLNVDGEITRMFALKRMRSQHRPTNLTDYE